MCGYTHSGWCWNPEDSWYTHGALNPHLERLFISTPVFLNTHTHAHHYPHHHRALNMNKAAVCLNYRFVTSLAPSLPSSLPPCEQWKFVASVTWATSICEVVIVLIWVSHAEPDSHVSRAVCVRAIILEVWVGWDYNCLPNSRTACRTLCMYLCSCMRIVIALAALPHYVLKMDVFTSFLSLCPSLS